jgi:hypothetical protein
MPPTKSSLGSTETYLIREWYTSLHPSIALIHCSPSDFFSLNEENKLGDVFLSTLRLDIILNDFQVLRYPV